MIGFVPFLFRVFGLINYTLINRGTSSYIYTKWSKHENFTDVTKDFGVITMVPKYVFQFPKGNK